MVVIIILHLTAHFPSVQAVNLKECGARLRGQQDVARNTTNTTGLPSALVISYQQCLIECGTGMGDIDWQAFSQNFGSWYLPWLALLFQIPFGAERMFQCYALTLR